MTLVCYCTKSTQISGMYCKLHLQVQAHTCLSAHPRQTPVPNARHLSVKEAPRTSGPADHKCTWKVSGRPCVIFHSPSNGRLDGWAGAGTKLAQWVLETQVELLLQHGRSLLQRVDLGLERGDGVFQFLRSNYKGEIKILPSWKGIRSVFCHQNKLPMHKMKRVKRAKEKQKVRENKKRKMMRGKRQNLPIYHPNQLCWPVWAFFDFPNPTIKKVKITKFTVSAPKLLPV